MWVFGQQLLVTFQEIFLYLLTYSYTKDRLQAIDDRFNKSGQAKHQAPWVSFTAAGVADLAAAFAYSPVSIITQRLFIQDPATAKYKGAFDAFYKITTTEGIRGLYRGFGAYIFWSLPASAIWWTTYEFWKAKISRVLSTVVKQKTEDGGYTLVVKQHRGAQAISGAIAGGTTAIVTNPLLVLVTRLQTQHLHHSSVNPNSKMYKNSLEAMVRIFKEEGPKVFMKGVGPSFGHAVFVSCIGALVYEYIVKLSTIEHEKKQES